MRWRAWGVTATALEAVENGLRQLDQQTAEQSRMLDAETQIMADQTAGGQVRLASGFDVVGYRHDPIAQERDWERAKQLDGHYARLSRARFDEDNRLYWTLASR